MKVALINNEHRLTMNNIKSVVFNGEYAVIEFNYVLTFLMLSLAKSMLGPFSLRVIDNTKIELKCEICSAYE